MNSPYIDQRDGGYYVSGVRVSLDSVIYAFNRGESPEEIMANFPAIGQLSRIHGAIAFYLDHKAALDQYLLDRKREIEASSRPMAEAKPALWQKIQHARAQMGEPIA